MEGESITLGKASQTGNDNGGTLVSSPMWDQDRGKDSMALGKGREEEEAGKGNGPVNQSMLCACAACTDNYDEN